MSERQFFTVKILKKTKLTGNMLELTLAKPEGFSFVAGQYIQFKVVDGEKFVLRSYSVASLPSDDILMFGIKIIDGGKAGEYFKQVKEGQSLEISLPLGHFNCLPQHLSNKFFVATSCGLAPFLSMMEIALQKGSSVSLLFGVRFEEDIFWQDRLDNLKNKYSKFNYSITLSKPSETWKGLGGRVTNNLDKILTSEPAEYYLCGNAEMVKDVRKLLAKKGADFKRIHFEIF